MIAADVLRRHVDGAGDHRLLDPSILPSMGNLRRVVELDDLAVLEHAAKAHGRRGRDEVEVVLALEPLLDDLHVEQAQEAAAEPEAERRRGLGLARHAASLSRSLPSASRRS